MKIDITWHDPNGIEDGYKVYRGEGAPVDSQNPPAPIVDLPPDSQTYADVDVTFGGEYFYTISSYKDDIELFGNPIHAFAVPQPNVYGVDAAGYVTKIDPDGNEVWRVRPYTSKCLEVCVDYRGYLYVADEIGRMYKLNNAGTEQWVYNYGSIITDLAIDDDNAVYGLNDMDGLVKLNPYGSVVWTINGIGGSDVHISDDNRIFVADVVTTSIVSFDKGGIELEDIIVTNSPTAVFVDDNDELFYGHATGIVKLSSARAVVWTFPTTDEVIEIRTNQHDGSVIVSTTSKLYKLDSSGNEVGLYDPDMVTAASSHMEIHYAGEVYSAASAENVVRKLDENLNLVWEYSNTYSFEGVAVDRIQFNINPVSFPGATNV